MKIRILLKEAREKRGLSMNEAAKVAGFSSHLGWRNLEYCLNEGKIETWKKISKALSIKDKDMWKIITTYKYVVNPKKIK